MPPFVPYKRRLSTPPAVSPTKSKASASRKPSLFDTADRPGASVSLQDNRAFLNELEGSSGEDSTPSDVGSDEFEDVPSLPSAKKQKISHQSDQDEDEPDWEDAIHPATAPVPAKTTEPSGDLQLTLDKCATSGSLTNQKKGPSKIERQIRVDVHRMHVQFLLFHNLIRNGWACDSEVQCILTGQLPPGVKEEVERWKFASGVQTVAQAQRAHVNKVLRGRKAVWSQRSQRDWGKPAERQERGAPDLSSGDPLLRLLKVLAAYWKKKFAITAPGLRKQGYKSLVTVEEDLASHRNDKHNPEEHGERVNSVQDFRNLARVCEGSKDIGAQLFTSLIRGLGIRARLVASLQPIGFGWSKGEMASSRKKKRFSRMNGDASPEREAGSASKFVSVASDADSKKTTSRQTQARKESSARSSSRSKTSAANIIKDAAKQSSRGRREAPTDISEESEDSATRRAVNDEDDSSVVDVTPSTPRRRANLNYDRDMPCPTYWMEAISPTSNEIIPVDPLVSTPAVVTNSDHFMQFEPRGAKAEKAKQVIAYVVAYSEDGTAKDVTTRYLKRHVWPGRTKGSRMPVEKRPVYNRNGKIKCYEEYDWFKTVMSGYRKTDKIRTIVDDIEEAKDLKPVKPERKAAEANPETLQGYKSSAEFVLERHLRREEALRPGSRATRIFVTGKGDIAKEEPVFRRSDVEICRTGESWHKEGRAVKEGETPMKMVPIRAVTLTRKREVEEAERDSGEKLKQGLYARHQTDWIIPPPIENGIIPKNAYGNIDCFVPTMVPKGAVHVPLRSTVRICRRIGIDYAEAVTGFEFGNKMAVPVITGVVVAAEYEDTVIDLWEKEEEERKIKEEAKREKLALATWRKWLMGLRIVRRVRDEYGHAAEAHMKEELNPFTNQHKAKKTSQVEETWKSDEVGPHSTASDADLRGGFLLEDSSEGGGLIREEEDQSMIPLTLENGKARGPFDVVSSEVRRTLSAPLVNGHGKSEDEHLSVEDSEYATAQLSKSRTRTNNPPGGKRTQIKASISRRPFANDNKRIASSDWKDSKLDGLSVPVRAKSGEVRRAGTKRNAASQSTTAIESHYDENPGDEGDQFEAYKTAKPPRKKRKEADVPSRGRALRKRKR
ncbi:hypothetical protein MMC21_005015 [Puttea exsequens]|nr:hypothetical protein [Puttea exsequens]